MKKPAGSAAGDLSPDSRLASMTLDLSVVGDSIKIGNAHYCERKDTTALPANRARTFYGK